ncbi:MAG: imidazolonepropionase [Deltaproteobacteria bacterium]|nr:imidazolonepropionase [Deltaproteobacteria bacterium]
MILIRNISRLATCGVGPGARRGAALADAGVVENAAVLCDGPAIVAVGHEAEVLRLMAAQNAEVIDARGCSVIPGFVDAHTHPVFARTRHGEYERRIRGETYQQIAASGGGILSSVRAVREADESLLVDIALDHAARFLEYGTTTIEAKSGYGLDFESEMKMLRAIRSMGERSALSVLPTLLAHVVPPEYARDREGYVRLWCERVIPEAAGEGLAHFCDVYCDEAAFTIDEMKRIFAAAARCDLVCRAHVEQHARNGGALAAIRAGVTSVDHLEHLSGDEIPAIASSGATAGLLPGSVFHLGLDRYPPARALVDAGAAVFVATDFNPGSSPSWSMPMMLALACNRMKMTPHEALVAATANGAASLGLGDRGRIEPGARADLVILDGSDERRIPYHFGTNPCRVVIVGGAVVSRRI